MKKFGICILGAISLFLLAGVFWSCKEADLFPEYRGVNIISQRGLGMDSWGTRRSEEYYINFEHPEEGEALDTDGLPDGAAAADIYRVEIPNLMPNGDFEASTPGTIPSEWVSDGGTPAAGTDFYYETFTESAYTDADPGQVINGTSFYYNISSDKTIQVRYDLANLLDGFVDGSSYTLRFDIRATRETIFEHNDGTTSYMNIPWILERSETLDVREFPSELLDPQFTAEEGGSNYLAIGTFDEDSRRLQDAYMDNIRIVRNNIRNDIYLLVPLEDSDTGGLELLDGSYKFSVFVKNDPTNTTGSAPEANRMPASGVSLGISLRDGDDTKDFIIPEAFHPDDEGADWSNWTELTAYADVRLSQVDSSEEVFLELTITPNDTSAAGIKQDAGSILIVRPWLEYLPEGIPEE